MPPNIRYGKKYKKINKCQNNIMNIINKLYKSKSYMPDLQIKDFGGNGSGVKMENIYNKYSKCFFFNTNK